MYRAGSGDSGQTTWWASRVISGAEADWEERGLSSRPWPNSQPNCYLRDLALVITDALASSLFSLSVSLFPLPANKLNYIRGEKKQTYLDPATPLFFFLSRPNFFLDTPAPHFLTACLLPPQRFTEMTIFGLQHWPWHHQILSLFGFILFYSLSMLYLDSSAPSPSMAITKLFKVRFRFSRL